MTVDFADFFSAEHAGYEILYQNMKHGLNASKELSEFLRERSGVEEANSKLLSKLAKQTNGGCSAQGSFAPVWAAFRGSAERLATLHHRMFQKVGELVKDVSRYADDLHKKHKAVKDSEAGALELALAAQAAKQALAKARDQLAAKTVELDRLRRDGASAKDVEKLELKTKKLRDDCDALSDKFAAVERDFEKRMGQACRRFQDVEEAHLRQMKQFVSAYVELVQNNHDLVGQVHVDFKHRCLEMTVEKLLERFALDKYGALERPAAAAADVLSTKSANDSVSEADQVKPKKEPTFAQKTSRRTTSLLNLFTPNFQSRDEPGGACDGPAPCSAPSSPSGAQAGPPSKPDETRIGRNALRESRWFLRSRRAKAKATGKNRRDKKRDESRSDLDEKEEEEEAKPADAEVDADADALSAMSPEADADADADASTKDDADKASGYSTSDSETDDERDRKIRVEIKPLTNGAAPMSASVDELVATVENLTLPASTRRGSSAARSADPFGFELDPCGSPRGSRGALLESPGEKKPSGIALPRPPSRRSEGSTAASRGPSPLTIGMTDTVPLAVAFHEIVHCYFKGTDETACRVKMSGDVMVSFPTGIVGVLANNPNPARLRFKLKNASKLESVLPNRRLVSFDDELGDDTVVEFDMNALTSLLRRQSEKNPGAAYFNVDILKYQIKTEPGAASCPLQLVAYWKREKSHTDLKIDYKYNARAMSSPSPLLNLCLSVPIGGRFDRVSSKPSCETTNDDSLAWKFTELSQHSDDRGVGSLRARVELVDGPSPKATISSQFNCEGATLSGVEFELAGSGYRLSLVKRRFVSGKYICDGD